MAFFAQWVSIFHFKVNWLFQISLNKNLQSRSKKRNSNTEISFRIICFVGFFSGRDLVLNPVRIEIESCICFRRWKAMFLLGTSRETYTAPKYCYLASFPRNFWKDSCKSEHMFTWAWAEWDLFWRGIYLLHACLGITEPHTKCCSDACWCSGPTTRIVLSLHHEWLVDVVHTHTNESWDMDYLKGPSQLRYLTSSFCSWISFFFSFLLPVCLTKMNTKINSQETRIQHPLHAC